MFGSMVKWLVPLDMNRMLRNACVQFQVTVVYTLPFYFVLGRLRYDTEYITLQYSFFSVCSHKPVLIHGDKRKIDFFLIYEVKYFLIVNAIMCGVSYSIRGAQDLNHDMWISRQKEMQPHLRINRYVRYLYENLLK